VRKVRRDARSCVSITSTTSTIITIITTVTNITIITKIRGKLIWLVKKGKKGNRRGPENPGFGISNIETLTRTDPFYAQRRIKINRNPEPIFFFPTSFFFPWTPQKLFIKMVFLSLSPFQDIIQKIPYRAYDLHPPSRYPYMPRNPNVII
jgi:hypothetical protein